MKKKNLHRDDKSDTNKNINTNIIWCPEGENFQYVKACEKNCRKKGRCKAFRDHFEPKLF